jgi:hypothetical protein
MIITNSRTWGEHANYYTTDAVHTTLDQINYVISSCPREQLHWVLDNNIW